MTLDHDHFMGICLEHEGGRGAGMTMAEFAAFLKSEAAKWGKLVRDSGAKAE